MNHSTKFALLCFASILVGGCGSSDRSDEIVSGSSASGGRPYVDRNDDYRYAGNPSDDRFRSNGSRFRTGDTVPAQRTYSADAGEPSLDEIVQHVQNGTAVLIDARSPEQYARGHVRGALNLPATQVDSYVGRISKTVSPDQLVIIYCDGQWCHASDLVAERLTAQGFTKVRVYSPGWLVMSSVRSLQ